MAGKTKGIKGLGARYGRKIRNKLGRFQLMKNEKKKCPYCNSSSVKRKVAGIWHCKKCDSTFTGRAYQLGSGKIKQEVQ